MDCDRTDVVFVKHLGSGSMGSVDLVDISGQSYAMKTISKNRKGCFQRDSIAKEIAAGKLNHRNIISISHHWQDKENTYLLMDYVNGCDLYDLLKTNDAPLPEQVAFHIFKQILDAMGFLHTTGIAHRDLKLDNIMVNTVQGKPFLQVKVIDFGLCETENADECRGWVGSAEYCAPEISSRYVYDGFQADVWSLGIVLFALLFGTFPYSVSDLNHIKMGWFVPIPFDPHSDVSESARCLLESMLSVDPDRRPTISEIMRHNWMLTQMENDKISILM